MAAHVATISTSTYHLNTMVACLLTTALMLTRTPTSAGDVIPTVLPDTCIQGPHHKPAPSAETDKFAECRSWKYSSCCTVNVSREIHHHRAKSLYETYHWDLCGDLSADCERFLKWEECFYQCEPTLIYYVHPEMPSVILDVPICRQYCESWFEACKNDLTCVEDWLSDFHWDKGENICPTNSTCVTFEEMYGNAKGMCNRMWGDAFLYHPDVRDCLVMEFDPERGNPNTLRHASSVASSVSWVSTGLLVASLLSNQGGVALELQLS